MSLIKAKRILALLLVLLMISGLYACGTKQSNQGGKVEVVVAKPDDKEPEPEPSWWELNVRTIPT